MKAMRIFSAALGALALAGSAYAAGGAKTPKEPEGGWPFEGPTGQLEQESVQRGYQVYREVCASCHSMRLLSYRNLGEPGGPFYDPAYPNANDNPLVKSFAAQDEILSDTPNDVGDYEYRPARTSDAFKSPYPNEQAARAANGGAYPPDLSVITKARAGGASYIYSLLAGYPDPESIETVMPEEADAGGESEPQAPAETEGEAQDASAEADGGETAEAEAQAPAQPINVIEFHDDYHGTLTQPLGQYYNPYMAGDVSAQWDGDPRHVPSGGFLAMPPQLTDGRVSYMDGTEATVEQMSYDVAQFLQWAGEPKQSQRKETGLGAIIYLTIFAVLLWFSYQRIWRNVKH